MFCMTAVDSKSLKPVLNDSCFSFQDRDEQVRLEKLQREEEDRLYRQFLEQREREHAKINNGVQEEWEVELEKLTTKFERELGR